MFLQQAGYPPKLSDPLQSARAISKLPVTQQEDPPANVKEHRPRAHIHTHTRARQIEILH